MFRKALLLSLATIFTSLSLYPAERFSFVKYEVDDGLSGNGVRCVVQDSLGFIWIGTADGLNRFDGRKFKKYFAGEGQGTLGNSSVFSLYVDAAGTLWIGTESGLYIYDHLRDRFSNFDLETENEIAIGSRVNTITGDSAGNIWIGTQRQGLFVYNKETGVFLQSSRYASMVNVIAPAANGNLYLGSEVGTVSEFSTDGKYLRTLFTDTTASDIRNTEITAIYHSENVIWFGMGVKGLYCISADGTDVKSYFGPNNVVGDINVKAIFPYSDYELLIGAQSGLFVFDTHSGGFSPVIDEANHSGTYHHSVNDIYRDREGGIWIATEYSGVSYIPRNLKPFKQYMSINSPGNRGGLIVTSFCEDREHNIWLGTLDGGLFHINGRTGEAMAPYRKDIPNITNIQCLMLDGDNLWIGTYAEGIYVWNTRTNRTVNYRHNMWDPTTIGDNCINVLMKDSRNRIYVGTEWGLNYFNRRNGTFQYEARGTNRASISDILEDRKGNIWISTYNSGVFRMGPNRRAWRSFVHNQDDPMSIKSDNIITIFEDDNGLIWFGTETGLCYYDYNTDNLFNAFDLPNISCGGRSVAGIEQDDSGRLWVSGNSGISCINIQEQQIENIYEKIDGLQSNQFNFRANIRTSDGKMYFGGINGYNVFSPREFEDNTYVPKVLITNMYVNSREVNASEEGSPLSLAVYNTASVKLKSTQNSIAFDFAALSYQSPKKNRYTYRLEGWDDEWSGEDTDASVSYSNLPPGKYRFVVRGTNNDGTPGDSEAGISILIRPPFYQTTIAYIVYLLLAAGMVMLLVRMQNRRREKENYRARIGFFTNLAHEIRTPLTLIKAPLERIIKSGDGNVQTRNYLQIMDQSATNLLNLINQLLDFRKTEEVNYELKVSPVDVTSLVGDISSRFELLAEMEGKAFSTSICEQKDIYNIDVEAVTKIINNVLSNALKYAALLIRLSLDAGDEYFRIVIEDDGKGVGKEDEGKIFKMFYQSEGSKAGTGIGLPLARLLTEKHGGSLRLLQSDSGAKFEIFIPGKRLSETNTCLLECSDAVAVVNSGVNPVRESGRRNNISVLVVEDDPGLRRLIADIIATEYSVHEAANGREALEILDGENVDIIVSDLMMPEMDGYELCEFVKSDMRYSHIPFINLTAKTSLQDRIKGLEYGADAYIEKPFSPDHLLTQISNLIANRVRISEVYRGLPNINPKHISGITRKDAEFIEKLNAEITRNLGNENFYIESLADNLIMSRSNFYRKIKGLLGVSPNEYLRNYRLQRAAEMLASGEYIVSDVYLKVGFNSISYFSLCFKKYYGITPTKYIEGVQKGRKQDKV